MKEELKGKKFLITGGTGSFGHAVTDRLLKEEAGEIVIFSRDEKKQFDMAKEYGEDGRIRFVIGDVREYRSIRKAMTGIDYVFHAAALKQVPTCEFYPEEAVKTNILGGTNVIDAAIEAGVKKVIVLSNDVTYVVRASEEEAYRNAGVRKLISAPDEEINTMSKVRQWILDNSPEDIIIQVDDDIKQILYRTDIVMEIKDPDVIDMEFLRIAQLLSDLKLGYATITVTPRPYLYQEEFKFNSMGGGIYWYNKECYKAKNDDKADCKEDVDKILQELMYNRIILMPKYLAMYVKTDTNEGGDNINKNSKVIRECNEYMKLKWGKYYTFDDKKNTVTIKVPR